LTSFFPHAVRNKPKIIKHRKVVVVKNVIF